MEGDRIEFVEVEPRAFGLSAVPRERMVAESVADAAAVIRRVLDGQAGGPRDIVVANAAAALWVAGVCDSIAQGVPLAEAAIDSGRASAVLAVLAERSHGG